MTLRFYDFEFNLLESENNVIKAKWAIYYNDIGTFEAHLPLTSKIVGLVAENRYLVAVQGKLSAIIVGKELRDELIIYGRTCNWLLSKRVSSAIEKLSAKPGTRAAEIALAAFSDVENFVAGDVADAGATEFESGEGLISDIVSDCLATGKLGHEVVFDYTNKRWVLNILSGSETDLILSEGHRNAYDAKISSDILDLATCGVYNEETEDGFVSASLPGDTERKGIYRWEALLDGSTATEAAVSLGKKSERSEATLNVRGLVFGIDYALGDVVRIQIIKGKYRTTQKRRISGVEVRREQGVCTEQPIFE